MNYEVIGSLIRKQRKKANLTQEELAGQCGVSTSFMGHIERGTRAASIETFVKICNTLHVSPSYLLQSELDRYRPPKPDDMTQQDYEKVCAIIRFALDTIRK